MRWGLLVGGCCVLSAEMLTVHSAFAQQQRKPAPPTEYTTENGGVLTSAFPVDPSSLQQGDEEKGPSFVSQDQLKSRAVENAAPVVTPQIPVQDVKVIPESGVPAIEPPSAPPPIPVDAAQVIAPVPLEAAPIAEIKRPALTREQLREIEVLQTRGIVEYNARRLAEAAKLFHKVLAIDFASFVALEYLAKISDLRGEYYEAIRLYETCRKFEPPARKKLLNFHIADIYMKQNRVAMAEKYFKLALRDGAFPIQTNYYLGYAALRQERWREAEAYFHEAERLLALAKNNHVDAQIGQPLRYYLGELYARLGYPRYALVELYPAMIGKSKEVTRAAWALEDALDRPSKRLSLGFLVRHDSEAAGLPGDTANRAGLTKRSGYALDLLLDLAAQTSPARKWSFGGEYSLFVNRYQDASLSQFDNLTHTPTAWVSWWNARDTEVRLRYEYRATKLNRLGHSYTYLTSHGPTLSWSSFKDRRRQLDAWYAFRYNSYPLDLPSGEDQRSGGEHLAAFRAGLAAPNPDFLPYGQFSLNYTDTQGKNFRQLLPTLELGTAYWLGTVARFNLGGSYGLGLFPRHTASRRDSVLQAKLSGTMPITHYWMGTAEVAFLSNISNLSSEFSYSRFLVTFGAIYVLPF